MHRSHRSITSHHANELRTGSTVAATAATSSVVSRGLLLLLLLVVEATASKNLCHYRLQLSKHINYQQYQTEMKSRSYAHIMHCTAQAKLLE